MLSVVCPNCQKAMKLNQPKAGKFSPTCRGCNHKFRLLIKELPDKTFRYKTASFDKSSIKSKSPIGEATRPDTNQAIKKKAPSKTSVVKSKTQKTNHPDETAAGKNRSAKTLPDAGKAKPVAPSKAGKLGPYRLIKVIGEGGMGSVFLANQTTLDRNVALKVIRSKLANDPSMLARFTREAYAAAQLVHPNVVQIYDMGEDNGNNFFSMELVNGSSLHELIGQKKRLDPEEATSYILHAARGLQCAHNAGMVHRDIKPANLLVNEDGLVKVADLGLVKVPDQEEIDGASDDSTGGKSRPSQITRVGSTIGTPYYMAPEQTKTSAVDHRADIYSLGCTFYVLLTGKRPFEGSSIEEVASKHTSEPLVLPSELVERVPAELSAIVSKMMAKRQEDRYQSASELIDDLEAYLGISSSGAFTPEEEDAVTIESACKSFNGPAVAKLRSAFPSAIAASSILLAVLTFFASWKLATGFLLVPLFTAAAYFVISGIHGESTLFEKSRELFYRSGFFAWIKWGFACILLVTASFLVGTFPHWLFLGMIGVGIGVGYYFLIDVPLRKSRSQALSQAESLIRKMRVKGVDEATLQTFVAKYSTDHWEEFFESLFGYAAKRRIREELSKTDIGKRKPKFRAWRDSIADNLDCRLEAFSNADDRKHLQKVEQAGLVADGVSKIDAKAQATQMAEAIVDHGDSIRIAQLEKRLRDVDPEFQRTEQRKKIKAMLAQAKNGTYRKERSLGEMISPLLNRLFGSYARFLVGCCLIVGCLMWAKQNDLLMSVDQLKEIGQQGATAIKDGVGGVSSEAAADVSELAQEKGEALLAAASKETEPFFGLFTSFDSLIAGLVLLFSTIVFGWRMAIFMIPAVIIAMLGTSFGIPDAIPFEVPHLNKTTSVIAIGLLVLGIVFGRES